MNVPIAARGVQAILLLACAPAMASTITVNSNADTGAPGICVLRDALTAANTNVAVNGCAAGQSAGVDVIQFALASNALTIAPASPLPNIVGPVTIDGYTQSGAVANTLASGSNAVLKVVLDGTGSIAGAPQTNYGFTITGPGSGSTIRGMVIANFPTGGIHLSGSSNNHIAGNFIGTNAAGTIAQGNGQSEYRAGVYITATSGTEVSSNNVIGGTAPADRNLISANASGITLDAYLGGVADGNQVLGNLIGTNRSGTGIVVGNVGGAGVAVLEDVTNTTIGSPAGATPGGACSGGCNVISGNYGQVTISNLSSATSTTLVQSNMIGLNAAGTGLPSNYPNNVQNGISVSQSAGKITIGGAVPAARNVIGGNFSQVEVQNFGQSATIKIQGNYIGTDATGTSSAGSGTFLNIYGVHVYNTAGVLVGGVNPGEGNLISGNGFYGVLLEGASQTFVQGNLIGTQADGISDLGNGHDGVRLLYGNAAPTANVIGAANSGGAGGNVIAYNGALSASQSGGVVVSGGTGNRISTNSIFANTGTPGGLGIDLGVDGVTPNQAPCATAAGANNLLNYPVDVGFSTSGGVTRVSGTLFAAASTAYTIEFYASTSADPSGYGQGKTYVGSTQVTTSASPLCSASFNAATSVPVPATSVIAAIAIDAAGNTSEFSQALDRVFADGFGG